MVLVLSKNYRGELGLLLLRILRDEEPGGEAKLKALRHKISAEVERLEERLGFKKRQSDNHENDGYHNDCTLVGLSWGCDEKGV